VSCEYCHTKFAIHLGAFPEEDRDAWRLWFSLTSEVRYLNPKAHALGLWLNHRPQQNGNLPEDQWQQQRISAQGMTKGQTAEQRLFSKLLQENNDLVEKRYRMLQAVYGRPRFSEQYELIKSVRAKAEVERNARCHVKGLDKFEADRINHLICAELEKIIWGEVRFRTSIVIKATEQFIDKRVKLKEAEEVARKRAEEAAKERQSEERQENIERENRYRRRLGMHRLPKDYNGSFTSYSELMKMHDAQRIARTAR
jgi:hypothetical protein